MTYWHIMRRHSYIHRSRHLFCCLAVRDDSATMLVTRTTVTARQTDKKLVGWVHALQETKTEAINVIHSSELQMAFAFPLRELEWEWTWEQQRKKRVWREEACCLTFKATQLMGNGKDSSKSQDWSSDMGLISARPCKGNSFEPT